MKMVIRVTVLDMMMFMDDDDINNEDGDDVDGGDYGDGGEEYKSNEDGDTNDVSGGDDGGDGVNNGVNDGYNDDCDGYVVDDSNKDKDVDIDDVNAGYHKNKVGLDDGDSNTGGRVNDVGGLH